MSKFALASAILAAASSSLLLPSTLAQHADTQEHYLVGLLNLPNAKIPDVLRNHTSGTYLDNTEDKDWSSSTKAPFADVPSVGFSDIEFYYDENGEVVIGEYYGLSDNGYGGIFNENSADYPLNIWHNHVQKPFTFRHGESTFEKYTEAENLGVALIHDPDEFIKWENGADIQVTYKIPDSTWDDWKALRVLTGRDIDPEGLAVINQQCAVLGDELMPAVLMVNPKTGVILSEFVRTPDIDTNGEFNGKFLSTRRDKVHCTIEALEADACPDVESKVVDDAGYRRHDKSGGYEGFAKLHDGSIAAFIEKQAGDTTLGNEPGVRVYNVQPGDCTSGSPPEFKSFRGFYKFEIGAVKVADVSAIPGSSRYVAVIERNGFPNGHMFPGPSMPANNLCIVDLEDLDESMLMKNKKCILNYHNIDDPWDVDGNGIFKYAQTQVTNEALIVVDDHCIVAGTDTNYPWLNQYEIDESDAEYFQEVLDARWMVVCFVEPIFNIEHPIYQEISKPPTETASELSASSSSKSASMRLDLALFNGVVVAIGGILGLITLA